MSREAWRDEALCAEVDGDLFFPLPGADARVAEAKSICDACDVRAQCLAYALDNNIDQGVWGGLSGNERAALKRRSG